MTTHIGVVIRIRPILEFEKKMGLKSTKIILDSSQNEVRSLKFRYLCFKMFRTNTEDQKSTKIFKFDRVLNENHLQEETFKEFHIENLINKVVEVLIVIN